MLYISHSIIGIEIKRPALRLR